MTKATQEKSGRPATFNGYASTDTQVSIKNMAVNPMRPPTRQISGT
jgi:hypothetical protein